MLTLGLPTELTLITESFDMNKKKAPQLNDLPVTEQVKKLEEICEYLTDKLCADLFPNAITQSDSQISLNLRTGINPKPTFN